MGAFSCYDVFLNLMLDGVTDVGLMIEGGCEEWLGFAQLPLRV